VLDDVFLRVRPEGSVLSEEELAAVRQLLRAAQQVRRFLETQACSEQPALRLLRSRLPEAPELLEELERTLDDNGALRDDATPTLRQLRADIRRLTESIQTRLESMLYDPELQDVFQESFVTIRNGRYVVPVRREMRARLRGVIHDHSDSGKTVFIEPQETLPAGNELAELHLMVRDESRRILDALSRRVRAALPDLQRLAEELAEFDGSVAVVLWARKVDACFPRIAQRLRLKHVRHPLLLHQIMSDRIGREVVPIDVELPPDVNVMVITGSNSGGKTVALKTVGLLCLMVQAGLPVPASPESEFEVFEQIYADIGDEQSLEQNLSTFSAHITRISQILRDVRADGRSLVLLDELGAGTDPLEGGVLACAFLAALSATRALTLATTHLGLVKTWVHEQPGMVNAAVRFDPETLQPEYVLDIGRPGASHALAIAARAGLASDVLDHARSLLGRDQLRLEQVLARLEDQERQAARHERELREHLDRVSSGRRRLEEELAELRKERRRILHEAWQQAERTVENTRRQMERLLQEARRRAADAGERNEAELRVMRRRLEEKRRRVRDGLRQTRPRPLHPLPANTLVPGRTVWIENLRSPARIVEVSKNRRRVTVDAGRFRATVDVDQVGALPEDGESRARPVNPDQNGVQGAGGGVRLPRPRGEVSDELHLRGLHVEEALRRLDGYLSEVLLAGLREVRIVHGIGSGRLREAVHKYLAACPAVLDFRLGEPGKDVGGPGVTFVRLDV